MKWMRNLSYITAVSCVVVLAGCTSNAEGTDTVTSPEGNENLTGITREEFMDMMLDMERCYKDRGADAEIFGWNPADDRRIVHRLNTSGLSNEEALEVEHNCLDGGPSGAMTYFLEQEDPGMEPSFRESVMSCLAVLGHDLPADVQNHYEMEEAGAPRSDISSCIGAEMEKLDYDLYTYFGGVQW